MNLKANIKKSKLALILLISLAVCNEAYRFWEIRRLQEYNCQYTGMERKGEKVGLNPSRNTREYVYTYECNDGIERNSIYKNNKFKRPWE